MKPLNIKVKYLTEQPPLEFVAGKSDWVDLRAAKDVFLVHGQSTLIPLGIAVKLPEGYEAHLAPRSSTFARYGIIQTNSVGVIDESYSGDDDEWKMPVYCLAAQCSIKKGDRIAQFRIMPKMGIFPTVRIEVCPERDVMVQRSYLDPEAVNIEFETKEHLSDENRGGFGSTGAR
jgi:dUTP pyrophosphatase